MLHWKFCLAPTTQSSNHRFSYFATLVIINRIAAIYAFSFLLNIQPENSLMEVSRCVRETESFIKEEAFTSFYFFSPKNHLSGDGRCGRLQMWHFASLTKHFRTRTRDSSPRYADDSALQKAQHRTTKTLRFLGSFCKYYRLCFTLLRHCQPPTPVITALHTHPIALYNPCW